MHLSAGVCAGFGILLLTTTGALLAFERQILDAVEARLATSHPAGTSSAASLDDLAAQARRAVPRARLETVTLRRSSSVVVLGLGERGTLLADRATGELVGSGTSGLRGFFESATRLHRWLGLSTERREIGRAVTGAGNAAFFVLAVSGLFLWWPRRLAGRAFILVPDFSLRGWRRDWNWHHAVGIWCVPVLIVITATGLVMSYRWAERLLYAATGTEPPRRAERAREEPGAAKASIVVGLDRIVRAAEAQAPAWRQLSIRLPRSADAKVTALILEEGASHPYQRSTLTLRPATAEIDAWEPYASLPLGRRLRSWVRALHTGEALGWVGQLVAGLASLGATVLVWTGSALAWRRARRTRV